MKLAVITPDYTASCLICTWKWKVPARKKKGELSPEDRVRILEQNVLAHLRDAHDRIMLIKDVDEPKEEGVMGKIYYSGRRMVRER